MDNNFKNKNHRRINKKYILNKNKSLSLNNPPFTSLESSLNVSSLNNNTFNKPLIKTIPHFNTNIKNNNNNRLKDCKYIFEELNRKFNSLKVEHRRRERSLTGKHLNNIYNNNIIKRAVSYSKLRQNTYSLDKIKNEKLNEINNNLYIQTQNNINSKYFNNKSRKIDFLQLKINTMINNFDKDTAPNKKPFVNSFKYGKNYNLFYNYNKSKPNNLNFISNKENDINKFNIFAKSKLMDINDIKNINAKNSFFDYNYNYNRNYNKKLNNNNINMENNSKTNLTIKHELLNRKDFKNIKNLKVLFQYIK